jgi:GWxTD domain-containing protein
MLKQIFFTLLIVNFLTVSAQSLKTTISYATFYSPEQSTYLETYFSVHAGSLSLQKNASDKLQGSVEVTLMVFKNDQFITGDKLRMHSPEYDSPKEANGHFVQQIRMPIAPGSYEMRIRIRDVNNPAEDYELNYPFDFEFETDKVSISNIQLIDSYSPAQQKGNLTKSGYDMVPLVPDGEFFFGEDMNKLIFYSEIYHSSKLGSEMPFVARFYLEDMAKRRVLNKFSGFQKFESGPAVLPFFKVLNISELPRGFYALNVVLLDRNNEKIAQQELFFYRDQNIDLDKEVDEKSYFASFDISNSGIQNKLADPDTLKRYLESIYPISTIQEQRIALTVSEGGNLEDMQLFFINFWRSRNPESPVVEWQNYYKVVQLMDKKYGTRVQPGYRSDRGRVFLQYGAPTLVEDRRHEPSVYPFEIWQYNQLQSPSTISQNNRVFVFANLDIGSRDYRLIHSDAIGEIQDPRWMMRIRRRDFQINNIDETGDFLQSDQPGSRLNNNIIMQGANPRMGGYQPY